MKDSRVIVCINKDEEAPISLEWPTTASSATLFQVVPRNRWKNLKK